MRGGILTHVGGVGASACALALVLWPFYRRYGEPLLWPFALAAGLACLCGLGILLVTVMDMLLRRRGARIRPVRGFDIAFGLGLVLVGLLALQDVAGQQPG